jgi:hypothetical protein
VSVWRLPSPEPISSLAPGLRYASPSRRLAASLVDLALVATAAVALLGVMFVSGLTVAHLSGDGFSAARPADFLYLEPSHFAVWWLMVLAGSLLYFVASWSRGGSPGGRLLAIDLRAPGGATLSMRRAALRWLVLVPPPGLALLAIPFLSASTSCAPVTAAFGNHKMLFDQTAADECTLSAQAVLAAPMLLLVLAWPLIGLVTAAASKSGQGFHDRLTGSSMVVRAEAAYNTEASPAAATNMRPAIGSTAEATRSDTLPPQLQPASTTRRTAAYAIDILLLYVTWAIVTWLLAAAGFWHRDFQIVTPGVIDSIEIQPDAGIVLLAGATLVVSITFWRAAWSLGGSPGQRLLLLQIGDPVYGSTPQSTRLATRWLLVGAPLWVEGLGLTLGGYALSIVALMLACQVFLLVTTVADAGHRGLQDRLGGTLVVEAT